MGQLGLLIKVCFVWGALDGSVPQHILQVHGVDQCVGPKTGQKHVENVDGWFLRVGEEAPGIAAAGIRDKAEAL